MYSKNIYDGFIYDWWKNLDKVVFFLILLLVILGIFFSLVSTSLIASTKLGTNSYYFFLRHSTYVLLGLSLIIIFSALREEDVYKIAILLFIIFFCISITNSIFRCGGKRLKKMVRFYHIAKISTSRVFKTFFNCISVIDNRI